MENTLFNPLEDAMCLETPQWLQVSAWTEHVPFAMFLMNAMRPRIFVELGAFRGVSYCAFCQSAKESRTGTKCFAVDTWEGDAHAGALEKDVLEILREHHDPLYGDFSTLVQSTFDDALTEFEEKSVDLLHIDGYHTYEAVSHDFNTWLPKMSDCGIVLFHDTNVWREDFGVWKFWAELTKKYPHFEFMHCNGLGVLAVGANYADKLKPLFEADAEQTEKIRKLFHGLGAAVSLPETEKMYQEKIDSLEEFKSSVMENYPSRMIYLIRKLGFRGYLRFQKNGQAQAG